MKLIEVTQGINPEHDYIVYKVSSPNTEYVYYGYGKSTDLRAEFLQGAHRSAEPDRGDVRMLMAAGGEDGLKFEMIDIFQNEVEAFVTRNDARAADSKSITGPSNFPASIYQRAKMEFPDSVKGWGNKKQDINAMSAREAMGMPGSAFTYNDVKALATNPATRKQIVQDLDNLSYPAFRSKYFK